MSGVEEALAFSGEIPHSLVVGEDGGRRPEGFDLPNSPVEAVRVDVQGCSLVQRTSAGTQGVVAAIDADRLFPASLVCASATATAAAVAIEATGLGVPSYVITGRFPDKPDAGLDDYLTAEFIEPVRLGRSPSLATVAAAVASSDEAARTLAIGGEHVHTDDIS